MRKPVLCEPEPWLDVGSPFSQAVVCSRWGPSVPRATANPHADPGVLEDHRGEQLLRHLAHADSGLTPAASAASTHTLVGGQ
jgi:hypothetical protein